MPGIKSIDIPSYSKPNHIGDQSITANSLDSIFHSTANYSTTLIVSAGNSINETEHPTSLSITCDEKSIKLVEQFLISMVDYPSILQSLITNFKGHDI